MTHELDARAKELDRAHVFHSWSAQEGLDLPVIAGGSGAWVWNHAGERMLDLSSQLVNVNIGHQHPAVVAAIQEQAGRLATIGPATANLHRGEAAARILDKAPDGFAKVFFTNGGADANENAVRMARLTTGRDTVLSTYRSYHGNTGGAIVATGDWRRMPNQYARGHVHFFGPYLYRSEFWATTPEEECERALHHLRRVIESEGPQTIAAVLLESVPGTAGILVPPAGYLAGVRHLCDEHGIVLILDEVMAGFGRTGQWFAFERHGIVPDLITFAKGVNSGYVPVGGVIISEAIAAAFDDRVFPGGLTYSGHPLAAASIIASIDAMTTEGIVEHARTVGADVIGPSLRALADDHDLIGEVRGEGVFWAVELVADRGTRVPVAATTMAALKQELSVRGVMAMTVENRIHVVPPCVVTADDMTQGMVALDGALAAVAA
ncbi:MAG: aspartate aminotransferase family protein [Microbacterium sp.]|uniref:aspartate aminotransferase family protein n=1 Tax=unclassified Microbacterium TaxID=2609290 RepID=UPI000C493B2F|nr:MULTISPECIES: aspartate aminotransferase family protein [unclassified Microbacterium]MAY48615.1 aspartate aminotransferase family protein [Microbacterium sp.]HAS30951.1 aspartate aminotransferase family protein [Microbacterium sp.]HBR90074.1 aspartate aminotransferase family protein [Microbacterium sp.]HBS73650.1 aspartate aminotransferase family protein [Microbacterium sp.]|tara:strand:+ start:6034 stop:7341 length:1308 start_codon:yes stop_codon:yes gene_type:complete